MAIEMSQFVTWMETNSIDNERIEKRLAKLAKRPDGF